VRNKVIDPHLFDYECFYITFDTYDDENRRSRVNVVNEMERGANRELQTRLPAKFSERLLNRYKGSGYLQPAEREARRNLMTVDRRHLITSLIDSVIEYIESFNPEFASR
jgi:hypothetical protein